MSRRTETAYKAKSPGKSAQHDEALGSGDMVNAVRLGGCSESPRPYPGRSAQRASLDCYGSRTEAHFERNG